MELQYQLEEIESVAKKLIENYSDIKVWAFFAEMGMGKTTLIRALCKQMGVLDTAASPTFAIINEYLDRSGKEVYHYDFYRIEDEMEAFDLGIEDQFYSNSFCFIEWPEKITNLLPENYLEITITGSENSRTISAEKI